MRVLPYVLVLATTAAFAQLGAPNQGSSDFQRTWTLGAQSFGPTLTGNFNGTQDGQKIQADLDADLGLSKDKATPGLFLDYQGPRFAFQITSGTTEYRGDRKTTQQIFINNQSYDVGTQVQSHVKLTSVEGIWTIKYFREGDSWLGLDLGAQVWTLDMDVAGQVAGVPQAASSKVTVPIPQIGLSGGSRGFNGAFESKTYLHYLAYKKAKYTLFGADVRIFPVSWFGLRAFYEGGTFDVPKGSVKDDLELKLERKGVGFGAVFRF